MRKSFLSIVMATTLVVASTSFPMQVQATEPIIVADIQEGETRPKIEKGEKAVNNNGTVECCDGQLNINNGTVNANYGILLQNYGKLILNSTFGDSKGVVSTNHEGAVIQLNYYEVYDNFGTVTLNNGTLHANKAAGVVETNAAKGTVGENYNGATITTNDGTVRINYAGAVIETNNGVVRNNSLDEGNRGTITTNNGTVFNEGGIVETNGETGVIISNQNQGKVGINNGTITSNATASKITTNNGLVERNGGTIEANSGKVTVNSLGQVKVNNGTIESNGEETYAWGTVTTNNQTVGTNYATITDNFGTVTTNKGKIVNNFGGNVTNAEGGTIENQWYEYVIVGGSFKSGSTENKDAGERTWIGKAVEPDSTLGDYYITVAANEGMIFDHAEFNNGDAASYIKNEDGSLTFGNITDGIKICFKEIPPEPTPTVAPTPTVTPIPKNVYVVKYDGNGATSGTMKDQTCKLKSTITLSKNTFKRKGYTFDGWNTKKDGKGKDYKNKAKVSKLAKGGKSITLYAQWKPIKYNVKFNANGGKGKMSSIKNVSYGKNKALTKNKFTKKGYTFKGWALSKKDAKKGKVSYKNKAKIKNLTTKNGTSVTLYAVWTKSKK